MNKLLKSVLAVSLLFGSVSLGSAALAQSQNCWQSGQSHTCSGAETAAIQAAGLKTVASALSQAEYRRVIGTQVTVGALPSCVAALEGSRLNVNDAVSPTWHTALTGGGTVHVGAVCRGGSWLAE